MIIGWPVVQAALDDQEKNMEEQTGIRQRTPSQGGMTLIEILVVVAILAILASIGIWNYFIALERAKQKRTMADIRSIAMAWESYATEESSYASAGALFSFPAPVGWSELHSRLVPRYSQNLPRDDAWGNPFDIGLRTGISSYYAIRSRGKDGLVDASYDEARTEKIECDIIYSNGQFVIWPKDTAN